MTQSDDHELQGRYRLIGVDGVPYRSEQKGTLGGNGYGRDGTLDCPAALQASRTGDTYRRHRVFFADEATAIAAGYRPCGTCMPERFRAWQAEQSDAQQPAPMQSRTGEP